MSAAAERLLARLDGVRETGSGKWIARCPAHDDRSPSFSIRDVGDRVLVHCFAGCDPDEILAAVGLTYADLWNEPLPHHRSRPQRPRVDYKRALELARHEALVLMLAAGDLERGEKLSPDDLATVQRAVANLSRLAEGVIDEVAA